MYNIERQDEIINILLKYGSISVVKLAKALYVSPPTIRRDLTVLENHGKVLRTHGGVVLRKAPESEIPLMYREDQNNSRKRLIAKRASEYVKDGAVIFLDASSTAAHIVPYLEKFNDIIVVTNSPKTSMRLGEKNIKNYCTGGLLLAQSIAYVGSETEKFVSGINADIFFFSSRGYIDGEFVTDSSAEETAVKKVMLQNSEKRIYLCDSSKKNKKFMYNICRVCELTAVINDENDK